MHICVGLYTHAHAEAKEGYWAFSSIIHYLISWKHGFLKLGWQPANPSDHPISDLFPGISVTCMHNHTQFQSIYNKMFEKNNIVAGRKTERRQ